MPPGYHVELVASEPLVQDPVAIDWDPDGRLWAVEMPGFMPRSRPADRARPDRPRRRARGHERRRADGQADGVRRRPRAAARSLKVLEHGVLVAEPPNLWLMRDTNGDLAADTKELVTDQFGRREANPEHNANGLGGRSTTGCTRRDRPTVPPAQERHVRDAQDAARAASGASTQDDAGPHLPQHERVGAARRPRADARTSRATRTCCGRAAATSRWPTTIATT